MKRMIANIKDSPTGVKVPGNLVVDGTITQNKYELDQDITISNIPTGLNCNYAHARVSNEKLNIVISLYALEGSTLASSFQLNIGKLNLSSDILEKLYTIPNSTRLDIKNVYGGYVTGASEGFFPITCEIGKLSDGLNVNVACKAFTSLPNTAIWRFEFNFILS
jgi:hypothetical protein